jgi:hypothetical protein
VQLTILAGTKKGLFLLHGDESRRRWSLEGPLLPGWEVMHAILHDGVLYAATTGLVYSPTVHRSSDGGKTWELAEQLGLPEESGLKLERLWHLEPGRDGELWLGGAPAVLFRSGDGGKTWEPNQALLTHPTRDKWQPGAGGLCCHSIQLDPSDPQRMYIGISAVGTWRTDDGGETWVPKNKNVAADFSPDKYPEFGQCVHKLLLHPGKPGRLWQQNHCGVYRTDDGMETWERLDGNGLPSDFGFPLMLDPNDPDVAYVIPQVGAENRVTCDGRLGVYRTRDAGASWELASAGLPEHAWASIYRESSAFDALDPVGLYFGTHQGTVYASANGGDEWLEAASELPPVLSVEVAKWPS